METVAEIWREIPDVPNYEASSLGRIRSVARTVVNSWKGRLRVSTFRGRVRKLCLTEFGYHCVTVSYEGVQCTKMAHRLIAEAFIGPQPDGHEINHINGVKTDNRPENLEYVTHADNVRHSFATGLVKRVKLNAASASEIRRLHGKVSASELASTYGVGPGCVYDIWGRRTWKHIA